MRKKNIIITLLSLLFLLPGCGDDEVILPYKDQPGKRLNIGFCFGNRDRVPSCDPNSSVLNIDVYNVQDTIEE